MVLGSKPRHCVVERNPLWIFSCFWPLNCLFSAFAELSRSVRSKQFQIRLILRNSKKQGAPSGFLARLVKNPLFYKALVGRLVVSLIFSSTLLLSPATASAGAFSFVGDFFSGKSAKASQSAQNNSQNMPLLQATISPDPSFARGGGDITVLGDGALLPDTGPIGTQADIEDDPIGNGQISIYVVHNGDTLGQVAKMFGVSINTIKWANDISNGVITPGQKLIILPVSGIQYDIKKGDTIKSIAKKFKADVGEILTFNGLSEDSALNVGDTIIIPDGEIAPAPTSTVKPTAKVRGVSKVPAYEGYYIRPISYEEGRRTQGIHGYNGVDIGASTGTSIRASAEGEVIVSKNSGYNGGYGKYIVIQHGNGTQTLYGHLSAAVVQAGAHVTQGQIIGFVGNTGHSTGPHVHFEVRGAKNPF